MELTDIVSNMERIRFTHKGEMASSGSITSEDDELTLPRASINKMIKEILPNIRVANESRELILNCCTEFIHLLSSEANEICNTQQKKTINAEHVLQALDRLGFGDYRADAEAVLRDCKAVAAKRRRQSTRLENLGIPEEELLRQQQELFAKAREEQAAAEQQQWQQLQAAAQMVTMQQSNQDLDQEDYS
ncbi:protein Dr1 isoform X2 [Anabrus simplex]|uniref:protein Dr1 isoform X2 n=1 Tax=Anabrus simplex TaxID=316456 RepID=UPI0034DD255F